MKKCKNCGAVKNLSEFHKNKQLKDGHVNTCKVCACARTAAWVAANPERHAANCKAYRTANSERLAAVTKKWSEDNRVRSREIKKAWKSRNPDVVRKHAIASYHRNPELMAARKKEYRDKHPEVARQYLRSRRLNSPLQRISDAMGNGMRDAIRGRKSGKGWRAIVGYGVDELRMHLESLFLPGMTWDNYGKWHIDHIRPVSSFDFTDDPLGTARVCWAIENLQPLWAVDNMRKGSVWAM